MSWDNVPDLILDPMNIPPEVEMKAALLTNQGRPSLTGPGKLQRVDLNPYRTGQRLQQLVFQIARDLTREYAGQIGCQAPAHVLFPQLARIAQQYLSEHVHASPPAEKVDVFLSPYYGWVIERLVAAIKPDASQGEAPEVPRYERNRGPGSTADVDFWTSRDVREVERSHVNFVVADTKKWEQSAAYVLDTHEVVQAFVKNAGLGFAVPYLHDGRPHDYLPDFIVRLATEPPRFLILETKGFDPLREVKEAAAHRWVAAINADGRYGEWEYALVDAIPEIGATLDRVMYKQEHIPSRGIHKRPRG